MIAKTRVWVCCRSAAWFGADTEPCRDRQNDKSRHPTAWKDGQRSTAYVTHAIRGDEQLGTVGERSGEHSPSNPIVANARRHPPCVGRRRPHALCQAAV